MSCFVLVTLALLTRITWQKLTYRKHQIGRTYLDGWRPLYSKNQALYDYQPCRRDGANKCCKDLWRRYYMYIEEKIFGEQRVGLRKLIDIFVENAVDVESYVDHYNKLFDPGSVVIAIEADQAILNPNQPGQDRTSFSFICVDTRPQSILDDLNQRRETQAYTARCKAGERAVYQLLPSERQYGEKVDGHSTYTARGAVCVDQDGNDTTPEPELLHEQVTGKRKVSQGEIPVIDLESTGFKRSLCIDEADVTAYRDSHHQTEVELEQNVLEQPSSSRKRRRRYIRQDAGQVVLTSQSGIQCVANDPVQVQPGDLLHAYVTPANTEADDRTILEACPANIPILNDEDVFQDLEDLEAWDTGQSRAHHLNIPLRIFGNSAVPVQYTTDTHGTVDWSFRGPLWDHQLVQDHTGLQMKVCAEFPPEAESEELHADIYRRE